MTAKVIPTIANAVDFAMLTLDKRDGARVVYSTTTDPTLAEINRHLITSEANISYAIRSSFKVKTKKEEVSWFQYAHMYKRGYNYMSGGSRIQTASVPLTVNLLEKPIVSITSLKLIINSEEVDLVASADYTEGWAYDYYVDKTNGIIEFRNTVPQYGTPVKITYTYGFLETTEGDIIDNYTVDTMTSETVLVVSGGTMTGEYSGKLIEVTSGTAVGSLYRIETSVYDSEEDETTLTVQSNYTMTTDGLDVSDTFSILSAPGDIIEMVVIDAFLRIMNFDPTYLYTYTNPPEEFAPQYGTIAELVNRLAFLLSKRQTTYTLLN